jgi:hypothetical protein
MFWVANGTGTVVEHLPRHPQVQGLSPAPTTSTGGEKMLQKEDSI